MCVSSAGTRGIATKVKDLITRFQVGNRKPYPSGVEKSPCTSVGLVSPLYCRRYTVVGGGRDGLWFWRPRDPCGSTKGPTCSGGVLEGERDLYRRRCDVGERVKRCGRGFEIPLRRGCLYTDSRTVPPVEDLPGLGLPQGRQRVEEGP